LANVRRTVIGRSIGSRRRRRHDDDTGFEVPGRSVRRWNLTEAQVEQMDVRKIALWLNAQEVLKRKRWVLETSQFTTIPRGTTKQKSAKALMVADASHNRRFEGDPVTVKEALHPENPHHKDWRAAMQEEWASIKLNNTFGLPDGRRVDGQKPISSKWVFKTKRNPDSSIRYKARLVIRGYTFIMGGSSGELAI
jgi:hypothetical protein